LSPGAVAAISAGVFVLGSAVGAGLAVAVDRVPERPPEFRRSHPRAHLVAVMALSGLGFLLAFLRFGLAARLPLVCFFIAVMLVVAFIDWELMIIPNKIVLPAALVGLAASIALDPGRWWVYLAAAVGASLFLFILALIWPGGMGGGDIKLALFMGGVLGFMVIAAMFLAFLFGAAVGLILIATKVKTRKDHIPFGPYLALGSVIAILYGAWLADAYLGLLG
jgi:prepilin signal peptidase PulO-like enzyme (type II secretory pathway)